MIMKVKKWLEEVNKGNISTSGYVKIICDTCGYDFGSDTVEGAGEALEQNLKCPEC